MLGECHISFFILSSLYFYLTLSILGRYSDLGVSANLHISFYPPYISTFALNSLNLYSVDYSLFHVITYREIIRVGKEGWDDMQKSEKQYLHNATV